MDDTQRHVLKQAQDIVQYETQDKGFFGELFAWEARDGFWSKLVKTLNVAGFGMLTGGLGAVLTLTLPAVVGIGATAIGLYAGTKYGQFIEKTVFSEIHDASKTNLGKFSHWVGMQIPTALFLTPFAPVALVPAAAVTFGGALINVVSAMGISSTFGNQEQRVNSKQARALAEAAMERGVTVESLVPELVPLRTKETELQQGQHNTVTPDDYSRLQAALAERGGQASHAEQLQQQRAAVPSTEQAV